MPADTTTQPRSGDAIPTGETLAELLDERGMTQTDLAARLGVSVKHVNGIVRRGDPLSAEVALGLEKVFGVSATFWITREAHYRATLAHIEEARSLEDDLEWARSFPIRELTRRGYLPGGVEGAALVAAVLRFLGIADRAVWPIAGAAYRKSAVFTSDEHALAAWLRAGEIRANRIPCAPYDRDRFRRVLHEVRPLTRLEPREWHPRLVEACAEVGVAVVIEDTFPRARVNGAARWLTPSKALIQLNLRHRWEDIFWFTFFHEAGHVLLHRKKAIFVEATARSDDAEHARREDEANRFAAGILIPREHESELRSLSLGDITAFADRLDIAPAIVVGRLQHDGHFRHSVGNGLRRRLALPSQAG